MRNSADFDLEIPIFQIVSGVSSESLFDSLKNEHFLRITYLRLHIILNIIIKIIITAALLIHYRNSW